MAIRHDNHFSISIASTASIETLETFEENLNFYRNRDYSYIPMPTEGKYVDVDTEEVHELCEEQFVKEDASLFAVLSHLRDYPFLLLPVWRAFIQEGELKSGLTDLDSEVETEYVRYDKWGDEKYDEYRDDLFNIVEEDTYIITLADVNKRVVREPFYSVLSELENQFSSMIEEVYPQDSQKELIPEVSSEAIGRWEKAKYEGLPLHISEFLSLSDMVKIIAKSEKLRSEFGFTSRNKFDNYTGGLIDLRNEVMHATKTLVHDDEDLNKLVERTKRVHNLLEEVGVEVVVKTYDNLYYKFDKIDS